MDNFYEEQLSDEFPEESNIMNNFHEECDVQNNDDWNELPGINERLVFVF